MDGDMSSGHSEAMSHRIRKSAAVGQADAASVNVGSSHCQPETASSDKAGRASVVKKATRKAKAADEKDIPNLANHVAEELYSVLHRHKLPRTEEQLELLQLTTLVTLEAILCEWQKTIEDLQVPATRDSLMEKVEWAIEKPADSRSGDLHVFDAIRIDEADVILETLQLPDWPLEDKHGKLDWYCSSAQAKQDCSQIEAGMRVVFKDVKGQLGADDGEVNPQHEYLWKKDLPPYAAPVRKERESTKSAGKWSAAESLFSWAMWWLPNGKANMVTRKGLSPEKRAAIFHEWRMENGLKEQRTWASMEQHHRDMQEAETPTTYQILRSKVGTATAALISADAARVVAEAKAEPAGSENAPSSSKEKAASDALMQQKLSTTYVGKGKGRAGTPAQKQ